MTVIGQAYRPDLCATSRLHDDRLTCNHLVALNAGT
jgi:hypothetical protein